MTDELATADALAQAELVRRGEVKPRVLVEAAGQRIERVDPLLNSIPVRGLVADPKDRRSSSYAVRFPIRTDSDEPRPMCTTSRQVHAVLEDEHSTGVLRGIRLRPRAAHD
jgi:hypothetical protein